MRQCGSPGARVARVAVGRQPPRCPTKPPPRSSRRGPVRTLRPVPLRGGGRSVRTADDTRGHVLAYERDPDNRVAVRGHPGPAPAGPTAATARSARRPSSRAAPGPRRPPPPRTAAPPDTPAATGRDSPRTANLSSRAPTSGPGTPSPTSGWTTPRVPGGPTATRRPREFPELDGERPVLTAGRRERGDFGSRRRYAYDPALGPLARRTHGSGRSPAHASAMPPAPRTGIPPWWSALSSRASRPRPRGRAGSLGGANCNPHTPSM